MSKILALVILLAGTASAQLTTVADALKSPTGSGAPIKSLTISWPSFFNANGDFVPAESLSVFASNGAFTINLEPGTSALPEFSYTVRYVFLDGTTQNDNWLVPVSATTQRVSQIHVVSVFPSNVLIPLSQLALLTGGNNTWSGTNIFTPLITGEIGRDQRSKNTDALTTKDFCSPSVTDHTTCLAAWWSAVTTSGKRGIISASTFTPNGYYLITGGPTPLAYAPVTGAVFANAPIVECEGIQSTIIRNNAADFAFRLDTSTDNTFLQGFTLSGCTIDGTGGISFGGRVGISGTTVTWTSGKTFTTGSGWTGGTMVLGAGSHRFPFTIASVTDSTHLVLTTAPDTTAIGGSSNLIYTVGSQGILLHRQYRVLNENMQLNNIKGDGWLIPSLTGDADAGQNIVIDRVYTNGVSGWCVSTADAPGSDSPSFLTIRNFHFQACGTSLNGDPNSSVAGTTQFDPATASTVPAISGGVNTRGQVVDLIDGGFTNWLNVALNNIGTNGLGAGLHWSHVDFENGDSTQAYIGAVRGCSMTGGHIYANSFFQGHHGIYLDGTNGIVYGCTIAPDAIRLTPSTGTVNTNGTTTVTWATGNPFPTATTAGNGATIFIAGVPYTVATIASGTSLTTTTTVPTATGATYTLNTNTPFTGVSVVGSNALGNKIDFRQVWQNYFSDPGQIRFKITAPDTQVIADDSVWPYPDAIIRRVIGTNTITFTGNSTTATISGNPLHNGDTIRLLTGGTLPANLVPGKDYWVTGVSSNIFSLQTVSPNILGSNPILFSDAGSGTHTLDGGDYTPNCDIFTIHDLKYLTTGAHNVNGCAINSGLYSQGKRIVLSIDNSSGGAITNTLSFWNAINYFDPPNGATNAATFYYHNQTGLRQITGWSNSLGLLSLPVYANNAAAIAGGLSAGRLYRTGSDPESSAGRSLMLPNVLHSFVLAFAIIDPYGLVTQPIVDAINKQIAIQFCPSWHCSASVRLGTAKGAEIPVYIVHSPVISSAGAHSTYNNAPVVYVAYDVVSSESQQLSVVLDHEILETLTNPWNLTWISWTDYAAGIGTAYSFEVCDPVQRTTYMLDGVMLSDFVLPSWFGMDFVTSSRFDFTGVLLAPFTAAVGGEMYPWKLKRSLQ